MDKIRRAEGFRGQVSVLDLGCGKGGDLTKWHKAKVDHVVGVDIAATSIEQCKDRFHEMKGRSKGKIFRAEFHAVDCTKQRARDFYKNPDQEFDLVSCQFAFHYCFESLPQADCMLRNASENLRKGGFFIGTTPDAHDIMARLETGKTGNSFGNSVFSVSFNEENVGKQQPLSGDREDWQQLWKLCLQCFFQRGECGKAATPLWGPGRLATALETLSSVFLSTRRMWE